MNQPFILRPTNPEKCPGFPKCAPPSEEITEARIVNGDVVIVDRFHRIMSSEMQGKGLIFLGEKKNPRAQYDSIRVYEDPYRMGWFVLEWIEVE